MSYRELLRATNAARSAAPRLDPGPADPLSAVPDRVGPGQRLRRRLLNRLLREIEMRGRIDTDNRTEVAAQVGRVLDELLADGQVPPLTQSERDQVTQELVADISGMGPVDSLFSDPSVSDILINGPTEIWVDRFGRLERTPARFDSEDHLIRLLDRLAAAHGRHLDEASPYVDVRMSDGSRLHAIIPPLARVPTVSIRRSRPVPFRMEDFCAYGSMTPEMSKFLQASVAARLNMLISGGAASGKTTLLNVLSGFIPITERVVTIEETAELKLDHPHTVSLEARLPNIEGRGEVTLRTLVKNALRMRADRILVGEVRGPEVFDMLQAMNVGHEGSLTTVHANSPQDALRRCENLVLMGGFELPSHAIRELLAAAVQVLVHMTRFHDGTRRITGISEVVLDGDRLVTNDLFHYDRKKDLHVQSNVQPTHTDRLRAAGYPG